MSLGPTDQRPFLIDWILALQNQNGTRYVMATLWMKNLSMGLSRRLELAPAFFISFLRIRKV